MSEPQFVNLHTHSTYSTLDGFSTITEYIAQAKNYGQPALGITDHGNLHGVWELITQAQANGITPVPGCEFYVAPINPFFAHQPLCHFGARHGVSAIMGICSPPAVGEPYQRMPHP